MTPEKLMELADKYAFFMPGSEEGAKARQELLDAIEQLQADMQVPKGMKLVPIEPTLKMIDAGQDVEDLYRRGTPDTWGKVYRAMVAAAPPQPPAQPVNMVLLEALQANHQWHQDYDEHGGYPGSDLESTNVAAIALASSQPAQKA